MWMEINDKDSTYLVNADAYQFIRKGKDCLDEPTIIFADERGNDLILIWKTEEERDDMYQKILEFIGNMQGRQRYGR